MNGTLTSALPRLHLGHLRRLHAPHGVRRAVRLFAAVVVLLAAVRLFGSLAFGFSLSPVTASAPPSSVGAAGTAGAPGGASPELALLTATADSLERAVQKLAPRRSYVVIDRANNRLWVRRDGDVLVDAVVSTGSGTILKESGGQGRTWTFDTPPGRFRILSERRNPVWVRPDWAFLEEGKQPPRSRRERIEEGSLGEWALDLGDGYMIHGTLYERLLGRGITHGCIRVGRDDLRAIVRAVEPGTPVHIF